MENNLFNQVVMEKYSTKFKLTPSKYDIIKEWNQRLEKGQLVSEKTNHPFFQNRILMDVLGYSINETKYEPKEDEGLGHPDFILKADNKTFMVIELKGQKVNLDKNQSGRSDHRKPIDQAWIYAKNTDADWILVSNYDEFRLYNYQEKNKFISFKASELLDKKIFPLFMLIFSKKSHVELDLVNKLLKETFVIERNFENNFYKLYHETRLMLIKELEREEGNNFNSTTEDLNKNSIHYAQKILNRYMFVCFAEDRGLLPSNQISTQIISSQIKSGNIGRNNIWSVLNDLFLDMNDEHNARGIFPFNGGFFKDNLDFIKIRDIVNDQSFFDKSYQNWHFENYEKDIKNEIEPYGDKVNPIYRNFLIISSFNFSTELDVNVLGHIFENSIGDLEDLYPTDEQKPVNTRKNQGIFYTPPEITTYICENTIMPYLSKTGKATTIDELIDEYYTSDSVPELDEKLTNIKIIDLACGSGAFLNKAADILLKIHNGLRKKLSKENLDYVVYFSMEDRKQIIANNLYGVDLHSESVEITKLSLFLNIFKADEDQIEKLKPIRLPNLNKNIRCGNSIVNDSKYTNKPFNWHVDFEKALEGGGFDIVIGNPPYVRQEKIKEIKPYLKENYEVYTGVADLYVYFFEKGLKLLKDDGRLGFISSNKFIKANYGKNLRKFILENSNFEKYVDHTYDNVFPDATTYPSVFVLKRGKTNENKILVDNNFELEQSRLDSNSWGFEKPETLDLRDKIEKLGTKIKNIDKLNIFYGIKTGYNPAFIIDENTKEELIKKDFKNHEIIKPLLSGKDIKKWKIDYKKQYLIFTRRGIDINEYPIIKEYLSSFKERLTPKNGGQTVGRKPGDYEWYEIQDTIAYYNEFEKEKLIYPEMAQRVFAVYDNDYYYTNKTCFIIRSDEFNLKFLSALLSSRTLNFVFKFLGSPLQGNFYNLSKIFIEQLPIYQATPEQQKPFIEKADKMLQLNKDLIDEINSFKEWLQLTFNFEKFSKKLNGYYGLDSKEFLNELKKNKVKIRPKDIKELNEEFNINKDKIVYLNMEIEKTEKEIDQMVYELYGLTDEEINIIEGSLSEK